MMMANQRQRYDDKFRASAIVMLEAAGWPDKEGALTQVSKHLGIPLTTLHRWANGESNPAPSDLVSEKRVELSKLLQAEINAALGEMSKARPFATYRDLGTVAAILIDKLQLLNDKPTQNVQQSISFERRGVSSLPEHLTFGTATSITGEEAL